MQILCVSQQCNNVNNRLRFDKVAESLKVATFSIHSSDTVITYLCCTGPMHGCGGVLNLTETSTMILSSPDINNDGTYMSDLDCVWTAIASDNSIIQLQFNSFELDDQNSTCADFVEVR